MKILGKQKVVAPAVAGGQSRRFAFRASLQKHLAISAAPELFCLDAFSSREPVSTPLENALADPFAGTATARIADNRRTKIPFLKLRS